MNQASTDHGWKRILGLRETSMDRYWVLPPMVDAY